MRITVALILLFSLFMPGKVFANAAPVYLEKYPGFSIAPMQDCPLRVEKEELIFRIDGHDSSQAIVTAKYTLVNTSGDAVVVPMVFPAVSDGYGGGTAVEITFNGKAVDYESYIAGSVDVRDYLANPAGFNSQVDINTIIDNLNEALHETQNFDDHAFTSLYKVTFQPPAERQSKVSFKIDPQKTRILTFGFSGFSINQHGECTVSTYVSERNLADTGYILVLGEDTLHSIEVEYEDTQEKSSVKAREFILSKLDGDEFAWIDLERRNLDNLYSYFIREMDRSFTGTQTAFSGSMVIENIYGVHNISALLYEVEFAAGSVNELQLTYPMRATMDRRKTRDYVNTFAYLLNPARKFMDFGTMDIQIELNSHSPHIIESSLPLVEAGGGVYTLSLEGLPEQDLVFSTYPQKEITYLDSAAARLLPRGYGGLFTVLAGAVLLLAVVGIAVYAARRGASGFKAK